jgi:hypothetical protein
MITVSTGPRAGIDGANTEYFELPRTSCNANSHLSRLGPSAVPY